MVKYNKRRYLNYADRIPYAPHINLFDGGGDTKDIEKEDLNPFSGGLSGNLGLTISAFGNAFGNGLEAIGKMRELKWQEKQAEELAAFKRIDLGNQAYNQFLTQMQANRNNAIQELLMLALQTIALRDLRLAAALAELNAENYKPNQFAIGGLISAGLAIDKGLGTAIGGEYHNGVGDTISKLPGLGIVGGVTNALFGMKTDNAKLLDISNLETSLKNTAMLANLATSFDLLKGPLAINLASTNAYSGGIFNKSEAKKNNDALKLLLLSAEDYANRSLKSGTLNLIKNLLLNLELMYYAKGGLLNKFLYKEGQIYDVDNLEYLELLNLGYDVEIINR